MKKFQSISLLVAATALAACSQQSEYSYRNIVPYEHGALAEHKILPVPVAKPAPMTLAMTADEFLPVPTDKPFILTQLNEPEEQEAPQNFADAKNTVSDEQLGKVRGAFAPNASQANLNLLEGIASHNSVLNSVTGENRISAGSFQGTSGLVNVIQNTGNNTVIQSATIVNLTFGSSSGAQ